MLKILGRLLKNKDGFTATEIGLMAALDSDCRGAAADQVLKRSACCNLGAECTPPLSKTEGPGPEWGIAKVPARFSRF
jgi:hypothetical protein